MQALYNPTRIKYPMKRTNPRGEDPGWVRITWDEALDIAAKGLQENMDKYGPESLKILHGTSRITSYGVLMLGNYLGTPNGGCTAGQVCKGPRVASGALTAYPAHWTALNDGVECFFQWGSNQEVSNYDNAGRVTVDALMDSKVSICVGPRLQNLGKEADIWVNLRPGTDDIVAQSMIHVIVNEMKSYDELFVKKWTNAPFLYVADLEPSGFRFEQEFENGAYPMDIKTRLLKESDLKEDGNPRRFMVWDTKHDCLTYFDAETGLWEDEGEFHMPETGDRHGKGVLLEDEGFATDIDPALDGTYSVTLKDGRTVDAVPAWKLFCERVAEWTPEKAADVCWVEADTIRAAAQAYGAKTCQGGIQYQLANEHAGNAIQTTRTILLLSCIMGNLDTPGGNRGGESMQHLYNLWIMYAAPFGAKPLTPAQMDMVAGHDKFPLLPFYRTVGGAAWHHDQASATDMILTGDPYPITAMISATGSHHHSGNALKNWEAFKKLDFYWASELWFSPTVELADVVVPAAHFLEISNVRVSQGAESGYGAQIAAVKPVAEARWDSAMMVKIAERMGIPWWPVSKEAAPPFWPEEWLSTQWPDEKQMLELSVLPLVQGNSSPGPDGKQLRAKGWDDFAEQYQEHGQWDLREISPIGYYRRYLNGNLRNDGKPGFETPTMKVEILSTILETFHPGEELPVAREPFESPYSTPDVYKEYPIVLTSGRRIPLFFHSEGRQQPFCREQAPTPTFQINPETAAELGIEQGDWCWIESRRAKVRLVADLFYGIAPGVIECDHGWWFPELPAPKHGFDLCNINCLVDDTAQDPLGGASTLRGYLVKVYKAMADNCPNGSVVPCSEDGTPVIQNADDPRLKEWMPVYEEKGEE